MASRNPKQKSGFEVVVSLGAVIPWQACVVLALVTFVGLNIFAGTTAPPLLDGSRINYMGWLGVVARQFANIGQYLIPALLLIGALTSFLGRRRLRDLHQQVASSSSQDALEQMSWSQFEGLVGEAFRHKGYRVVERGGAGADGGIDIELYMGADKYLVQCKQWKSRRVGVSVVRELFGVMAAENAVGGFVVASGDFTPDAKDFAQGRSIELVDATKLRQIIGGKAPVKMAAVTPAHEVPSCPTCSSPMVERTVKKGQNQGNRFWGCSTYPKCRGYKAS